MKKHLALALVMIMALVLLPQQGFAAGPVELWIGGSFFDDFPSIQAAVDAAPTGATIKVITDLPASSGISVDGKNLTITSENSTAPVIAMENKLIRVYKGTLTLRNLAINMTNTVNNKFNVEVGDNSFAIADSHLIVDNSTMILDGAGISGRGIGHQGAPGSKTTTSIIGGSEVTAKNYTINGFFTEEEATNTLNIKGGSTANFNDNGKGGMVTGASQNIYVNVDASTLNVLRNKGNGSNGGHWMITGSSSVYFTDNGAHGLSVTTLMVEESTIKANSNSGSGIYVGSKFDAIKATIQVSYNKVVVGRRPGAFYLHAGTNTVTDSKLDLIGNEGPALHLNQGSLEMDSLTSLQIKDNRAYKDTFSYGNLVTTDYQRGAGVYVNAGWVKLPQTAQIYNNRAALEADDIFVKSGAQISFGAAYPGILNEALQGSTPESHPYSSPNHLIDGWYQDQIGAANRWIAHAVSPAVNHIVEYTAFGPLVSGPLTLKAAHALIVLQVSLPVNKVLKNGSLKAGEFTFQLRDKGGKLISEVKNAADGTVTFPDRTFSKEVTDWTYTIREVPGSDKSMTYDKTVYTVRITTKTVNGVLGAIVNVDRDGVPYAGSITFTNIRKAPATGDNIYQIVGMMLGMSLLLGCGWLLTRKRGKAV